MDSSWHILVAGGSQADLQRIRQALGEAPACRHAESEAVLLAALGERTWDVVLMDGSDPAVDAGECLVRIKEYQVEAPVILLAGAAEAESLLGLLQWGAADLVFKDRLFCLSAAIERSVQAAADCRAKAALEAVLRTNRGRQQLLVEQAPMAMAMFDRNMTCLAASRLWIEQFEGGRSSPVGMNVYELHPDVPERWRQVHRQALAGQTLINEDDYWLRDDGSAFWLCWTTYPWIDEAGEVGGIIIGAEDVTERKRRDAALQADGERMRLALQATSDGLWDWDVRADRLHLSGPLWAMTTCRPEAGHGCRSLFEHCVHPDDLPQVLAHIDASVAAGSGENRLEFRILDRYGALLWVMQRSHVVERDGSGLALRMIGSVIDISGRKAVEEEVSRHRADLAQLVAQRTSELHRSRRHLQAVLDSVPAMIGYWDKNLRNSFANYAYKDWFGIDPNTIPGKHVREVIGEERYALNLPYMEAALAGRRQRFEGMIPTPEGQRPRYFLAEYIPDVQDGEVHGFYVHASDVTALKQSEQALLESEERFRRLFEDSPIGIAVFQADGQCVMANDALGRIIGAARENLLPTNFREAPAWRQSELLEKALLALETGEIQQCEFNSVTSFGRQAAIESQFTTITVGGQRHLLVQSIDITARRLDEAQRLALLESQRNALVREVHHRIKNHLQGVISLLYERVRAMPQLAIAIEPAIGDIQTIAQAYGLQSARDDAQVYLGDLLESAVQANVGRMAVECQLPIHGSWQMIRQANVVPLALTINELLTNAMKHSRPEAGQRPVQVLLEEKDDGSASILIRNGPADLPAGFDFASSHVVGTGLRLVRSLLPSKCASLSFRQEGDEVVADLSILPCC